MILQVGAVPIVLTVYAPLAGQVGIAVVFLRNGKMSALAQAPPLAILFSKAYCSLAPSICFRLAMQAFFCAVCRALTKFGRAIAASKPIIATTIMISTRVKPAFLGTLIFIVFIGCTRLPLWSNLPSLCGFLSAAPHHGLRLPPRTTGWEIAKVVPTIGGLVW